MKYLIICPERTYDKAKPSYWKPNRHGYTYNPQEAGRYSKEEVDDICIQSYVDDYGVPECSRM